jgi:acyl-CoA thioesterase II
LAAIAHLDTVSNMPDPNDTPEEAVARFVNELAVEQVDPLRFRGETGGGGPWPRVFGGMVLAQASTAAARTVDGERSQHSLHAYFLRGGSNQKPIDYVVTIERDGRTFSARHVAAMQGEDVICDLMLSFARPQDGIDHADAMPEVPPPDACEPQHWEPPPGIDPETLPLWPFEAREVTPDRMAEPGEDPSDIVWMKLRSPLPDEQLVHTAALVCESDGGSLGAVWRRHGQFGPASASLDHAFWLHQPVRWDDWLLFVTRSPVAHAARSLSLRYIYTRDGLHVATMAQEALFRKPPPGQEGHGH